MVLTLLTGLLFLDQWHNTCEVTNSTRRRIWEPNFCHDDCKNLAKMRQAYKGAVGLCQKIVTPQCNNCASFDVVATAIQIMSVAWEISLLEQSSLSFHCHICCFISWSEVKFHCGIILVEHWNSYVVLIVQCVFILKIVGFLIFFERWYITLYTVGGVILTFRNLASYIWNGCKIAL